MLDDNKHIQNAKRDRGEREEIDSYDRTQVIAEKGRPPLPIGLDLPGPVLLNPRDGDSDSQFQKLSSDFRSSPD